MSNPNGWSQDSLIFRVIHSVAFEVYYWYSEWRTAIESGLEEAGWRRKGD